MVNEQDSCCTYSIDINRLCEAGLFGSTDYTIVRNGMPAQSLNVTNGISVPVTVCEDDTVLIEIFSDLGVLCYSEEFTCTTCCPDIEFDITSKNYGSEGDGCCEVTFEMRGSELCLQTTSISFIAKNQNGEVCYEETPLIYCES